LIGCLLPPEPGLLGITTLTASGNMPATVRRARWPARPWAGSEARYGRT